MRGTLTRTVGRTSARLGMILSTDSQRAMEAPRESMQWSSTVWPKEWAQGRNERLRSSPPRGSIPCTELTLEMMFPWLMMTPLGLPVVPEV